MQFATFLDRASIHLGSSFSTICVVAAVLWLTWRAYLVVNKPLDELVSLLGLEVPQGPFIDLAAVKADGVTLHWKAVDERKTTHRHEVQVNGTVVGEILSGETSVVVSNLEPDHSYVIRIIVINSSDFKAASHPIRVKTKTASSGDFYHTSLIAGPTEEQGPNTTRAGPVLRSYKTLPEAFPSPLLPPLMARETSNGPGPSKRSAVARRVSPAAYAFDTHAVAEQATTSSEASQQQLTEKLDEIGRDTLDVERQVHEEEQEAVVTKVDLIKERDELRGSLKEKDNASRELRKQVNALERENGAAQSKRNAQDRALQQKRSEMQKVKDDAERWARETFDFQQALKDIALQKTQVFEDAEREKINLQERQTEEAQSLKALEDDVKDRSGQIKKLEREKSNSPDNAEAKEQHDLLTAQAAEEERIEAERMAFLDDQYKAAVSELEGWKRVCHDAVMQLQALQERQRQIPYATAPTSAAPQRPISRTSSLRQRRTTSGPSAANGPSASGFPITSGAQYGNSMSTLPEGFVSSATPFFSLNGMPVDRPSDSVGLPSGEIERLTGGAPMSPSAGAALLPAGLLNQADEEPPSYYEATSDIRGHDAGLVSRPETVGPIIPGLGVFASNNMLPGLGASTFQSQDLPGPASPASVDSQSPRGFASPGASASNLAFPKSDQAVDGDGRSIHSSRSIRASSSGVAQSGSRFSQILGLDRLNRQRDKAVPDDGLAFGSLSKPQSQSMPRDALADESATALNRRRNSSHSGNFFGSVLSRNTSGPKETEVDIVPTQKATTARRRPFQVFGSKDGWPTLFGGEHRPVSPRPSSTHSTELPRPSHDSSSWNVWTSNDSLTQRNSPLSADWGHSQPAALPRHRIWGSRMPSRRPSAQLGPPGGVPYDIVEDDVDEQGSVSQASVQAPIGTRPAPPVERISDAKLNPAAKDFKSLFTFGAEKKERAEKGSKKSKDALATPKAELGTPIEFAPSIDLTSSPALPSQEDLSLPHSRQSRDTHSVNTVESNLDQHSRSSLDHTPSQLSSDMVTPTSFAGSASKESFMSKLSRKSSSGFGLPVFQREKKARNVDKTPTKDRGTVDEDKEAEEDVQLGLSVDSLGRGADASQEEDKVVGKARSSRMSGRSWSSVFSGKIGKGKEKQAEKGRDREQTPSISEASLTSASPSLEQSEMAEDGEGRLE